MNDKELRITGAYMDVSVGNESIKKAVDEASPLFEAFLGQDVRVLVETIKGYILTSDVLCELQGIIEVAIESLGHIGSSSLSQEVFKKEVSETTARLNKALTILDKNSLGEVGLTKTRCAE